MGSAGDRSAAVDGQVASLLRRAEQTLANMSTASAAAGDRHLNAEVVTFVAARMRRSVIRPLQESLGRSDNNVPTRSAQAMPPQPDSVGMSPTESIDALTAGALYRLACDATRLRALADGDAGLHEATAALQDLVWRFFSIDPAESTQTMASELRKLMASLPPRIQSSIDGPYLVTNAEIVLDWLGCQVPVTPQLALCRCGRSKLKPLCDGTHAEIDFKAAKDPKRVPDRLDNYPGQQLTILDNRGTCQHSGFCTDRLASAFRLGQEPFLMPSGGRMDELIRAVRDCPSGALSYAIDDVEAREQVDYHTQREATIEVSRDGPYRVRGAIPLVDAGGIVEARNHGASLEHYALCRCGHSQNKPFCSGMHWDAGFKDPLPDPDRTPTMFEWCGGFPVLTRMTRLFYEKYVPEDPMLGPLFSNMSSDHPQRVAIWLAEVFGGPRLYSQEYGGYSRMLSQHVGKDLTEEGRARWVDLLTKSAREAGMPNDPEFTSAFQSYIQWGSRLAVENSQTASNPPEHMPMPHWDWNTGAGAPGGRVSALSAQTEPEPPISLPAADEPVRFEHHIKPLFRTRDRQSMKFALDLWNYEQVTQNADAILERVQNGTMPCDGAWSAAKVEVFERWKTTGMSP